MPLVLSIISSFVFAGVVIAVLLEPVLDGRSVCAEGHDFHSGISGVSRAAQRTCGLAKTGFKHAMTQLLIGLVRKAEWHPSQRRMIRCRPCSNLKNALRIEVPDRWTS